MKSKKTVFIVCFLIISLFLCGCKDITNEPEKEETNSYTTEAGTDTPENEETVSYITEEGRNKYIIQDPFYQIYEEDLQVYRYKIATSRKVFAQGVKKGTEPQIDTLEGVIIRLFMSHGTNAYTVQYFDVFEDRTSEEFTPYTNYADYIDDRNGVYLIAYFQPAFHENNILRIRNIFSDTETVYDLEQTFDMPICNSIIFLNESEIYLDYDAEDDENPGEYKNIREVIKFR